MTHDQLIALIENGGVIMEQGSDTPPKEAIDKFADGLLAELNSHRTVERDALLEHVMLMAEAARGVTKDAVDEYRYDTEGAIASYKSVLVADLQIKQHLDRKSKS